ncbi:UNVERIFIED_CONTAM: endo n acetylneuraminidase [Bacteriophage sp.]
MAVPYTFATATSSIPLSQLDSNFATAITLGSTALYLGNTTTSVAGLTLTGATLGGTFSGTSVTDSGLTSGRVTYAGTGGLLQDSANLTFNGTTLTAGGLSGPHNGTVGATTPSTGAFTTLSASSTTTLSGGTANGVAYLDGSKVLTTGSALTFDGQTLTNTRDTPILTLNDTAASNVALKFLSTGGLNYIQSGISGGAFAPLIFSTNGGSSEKMRLDTSGNLGLGVTPSAWTTFKAIEITGGAIAGIATNQLDVVHNAYYDGSFKYKTTGAAAFYQQAGAQHAWYNAASGTAGNAITFTQAMTLDASGNLLVGTTNSSQTAGVGFKSIYSATQPGLYMVVNDAGSGTCYSLYNTNAAAYRFYVDNGGRISATNTTISAISDIRYKENIVDLDIGLDAIMALKPRKFDWKEGKGPNIKNARGFIAQEFEQVFPDLIDEWKDPAPEGEEPYKSVRQDIIPVLVKAIQELKAEFDAYKSTHP